jgi:hypothetical protein
MTSTADPNRVVLYADQNHTGIRLVVFLLLLGGICGGYMLLMALVRALYPTTGGPDYAFLVACLGAIPFGAGMAALAEYGLKRVWPSGLQVVLDSRQMVLRRPGFPDQTIELADEIVATCWYFKLSGYPRGGRERHLAKDWFCVACQFEQAEDRLNVYAFMSPQRAENWLRRETFQEIKQEELYSRSYLPRLGRPVRPQLSSKLIAGPSGRYWLAERNRWQEGIELTPEDFETLMLRVRSRL